MSKRTFTKEEKLSILKEASEQGVSKTLEKYGVYAAGYYSWKEKLSTMGEDSLDYGMTKDHLKRIRELEKENKLLKQIVAEKKFPIKIVLWTIKYSNGIGVVIEVMTPTSLGDPDLNLTAKIMGELAGKDLLVKLATGEEKTGEKIKSAYEKISSQFPSPIRIIEGEKEAKALENFQKKIKFIKNEK